LKVLKIDEEEKTSSICHSSKLTADFVHIPLLKIMMSQKVQCNITPCNSSIILIMTIEKEISFFLYIFHDVKGEVI